MAYENIKFNKANMAVDSGYFFMIDEHHQILVQKCDDGSIAFQYPLSIGSSFYISSDLDPVICLQFDGYSFWSLQKFDGNFNYIVRRWVIDGVICSLYNQFILSENASQSYTINTIAIEHYKTTVLYDTVKNSNELYLSEYTDTIIHPDTVIGLGPNKVGDKELVTVSGVVNDTILLTSELKYTYDKDVSAVITPAFFVFNEYDGTDDTTGSLILFNANTGSYMSSTADIEYQDVSASKFTRLQNILRDYDDAYTLIYIKGNSGKLRNMGDLLGESSSYRGNDTFDGPDIDDEIWDIPNGNPTIVDNKLFMSTAGIGHDEITSTYSIMQDFDVQISGSYFGYDTQSEQHQAYRYLAIHERGSDYKYMISRSTIDGLESYSVYRRIGSGTFDVVATISGSEDNYLFRIARSDNKVSFYYQDTLSSGWQNMWEYDILYKDCYISVGLYSQACTISGAYFDDLTYSYGRLSFPSPTIDYFGVMNLDCVKPDQATYIPVYDLEVVGDNLYRLQRAATYYGNYYSWSTYNYQVSPIRSFVDFITVDSNTHIIPATGRNTAEVQAVVLDQYGQGIAHKPITFIDDDPVGYMTTEIVHTNSYRNHGNAISYYMSGTDLRIVTINVSATQYD